MDGGVVALTGLLCADRQRPVLAHNVIRQLEAVGGLGANVFLRGVHRMQGTRVISASHICSGIRLKQIYQL